MKTYAMILISCDSRENGLAKYEGFVLFLFKVTYWRVGQILTLFASPKNQMNSGLIFVHWVENNLS